MRSIALIICSFFLISCGHHHWIPETTDYYMDSLCVHVRRTTYSNKSVFQIKTDKLIVRDIVWNYEERNYQGLVTDGGTSNRISFTNDTIYLIGQGWHYLDTSAMRSDRVVVIAKEDAPSLYYERDRNVTTYMWNLLDNEIRHNSIYLGMYPEYESDEPVDTLTRIHRVNSKGVEFGGFKYSTLR